jgi:hypothetical protein
MDNIKDNIPNIKNLVNLSMDFNIIKKDNKTKQRKIKTEEISISNLAKIDIKTKKTKNKENKYIECYSND